MKADDVLLTPKERRELFEEHLRKPARFEDVLIEAQLKKLVEWGNQFCIPGGTVRRRVSDQCWRELEKLAGVE